MKKVILTILLFPYLIQAQTFIVGKWKVTEFDIIVNDKHLEDLEKGSTKIDTALYFEFNKDKTFTSPAWLNPITGSLKKYPYKGTYSITGKVLTLVYNDEDDNSLRKAMYNFELKDDMLKLSFDKPTLIRSLKGSKSRADRIYLGFLEYFKTVDAYMVTQKQP